MLASWIGALFGLWEWGEGRADTDPLSWDSGMAYR